MANDAEKGALIRLCGSKRTRIVSFSAEMPCRWQPRQFTDPRTRQAFTDEGAWSYIVEHLEKGAEIREMTLERPPGAKAFVLLLPGVNAEKIYVKLQICAGRVVGRSFHESESRIGLPRQIDLRGDRCRSN
ncbi:hypothetical protein ACVSQB_26305 [Bradyrhizobium elkanii]